jgi:hypothetical protein
MEKQTVIKIDLCKSKLFNREREPTVPHIRKIALRKLLDISLERFPYSDSKFPDGSFYKADGDAVFFILEKPTVAVRASIEFMNQWYHYGLKQSFPECRVVIHSGSVETTPAPGGVEVVGKVFEDLSIIEKTLDDGKIFVSEEVRKETDLTITKFVYFGTRKDAHSEPLRIFYLSFCDPRTFEDDALVHALFIAHKESVEIRNRILRFFLVEYLLDEEELVDLSKYETWARSKGYNILPRKELESLLNEETLFVKQVSREAVTYKLRDDVIQDVQSARERFHVAVERDIRTICEEIVKYTGAKNAIEGFDVKKIAEEYLCGFFSEIRMIANYFRHTFHLYDVDGNTFKRFDYILDRYLEDFDEGLASRWKTGFVHGLKKISDQDSLFISTIFHNILAGYYLNKSFQTSPYQLEKLLKRQIFVDTNILYALRCEVSGYHERVRYFTERLRKIYVPLKIYPFTVSEFEKSLEKVEALCRNDPHNPYLTYWNPWLYQEFRSRPYKYMNDIGICRHHYSVSKGKTIKDENYSIIETELKRSNLTLSLEFETYTKEEKDEIWQELREIILAKAWDIEEYWAMADRLLKQRESVIEHDVNLLENVKREYLKEGSDELGPKVMLITTDSKLIKCRKKYPFIITTEQFIEFMLPYLFLSDIPTDDLNKFPNQILSAQIGVNVSYWQPSTSDIITGFFKHPECLEQDALYSAQTVSFSSILSQQRLSEIIKESEKLSDTEKEEIASRIAESVEQELVLRDEASFAKRQVEFLKEELQRERIEKEQHKSKAEKLQKTLKYWKRIKRN